LAAALAVATHAARFPAAGTPTPYAEVRGLFTALAPAQLPEDLRDLSEAARETRWPAWLARRDRAIRDRLRQGDEDTVVLWMALGTSFTGEPRVTDVIATSPDDGAALVRVVQARAGDFVGMLASGDGGERAVFARRLLESHGVAWTTDAERTRAAQYVMQRLAALLKEQRELAARLRAARQAESASAEFAARSTLFHDRGLSLDTALPPNLAIAEALDAIRGRGLLVPGGVARAAVIGPGLDFADKDSGFDFYPIQTLQPFALHDTLLRLGLADRATLEIVAFDLSPRVLEHLRAARERAARGDAYRLVLPLDGRSWTPGLLEFWRRFGERIGVDAKMPAAPPDPALRVRSVHVAPEAVARITPADLNIVVERSEGERVDVIVATNVLVYYDVFEQAVAMANISAMLRPGGLLLTNTALPQLPASTLRAVGDSSTAYSDRAGDGDHVVWYRKTSGVTPEIFRHRR
jgi:SAM-dependent methyltransferase